jgi:Protein of unknown function (DUF3768)
MSEDARHRIRELNDAFRASLITPNPLGKLYATAGVAARGAAFQNRVIEAVVACSVFTQDIDPHGTHDMVRVVVDGVTIWGKIDFYDKTDPDLGAEDPSDPTTTERVMTVMLPDEY